MHDATLSLADVARLARVQRPVVSMWRRRPVEGIAFPSPQPDGRFRADDVVAYLSTTGRGNDHEPDLSVGITAAASADADASTRADLMTLLAARALLDDESLTNGDPETLLDRIDAIDPDDEWLFSEVARADVDGLAAAADEIADNSFSAAEAYEQLRAREPEPRRLAESLTIGLADLASALLADTGELVDVAGGATGVILAVCADESRIRTPVLLTHDATAREALRRYRVHGCDVRTAGSQDDWDLPSGSVMLAKVGADVTKAMSAIDDLSLQLGPTTTALVIGPASTLIDTLPSEMVGLRDAFLRRGLVEAAIRLPRGLTGDGGGEHLALWLMGDDDRHHVWSGDLSSHTFTPAARQQLLDDLVAVVRSDRQRAFSLLYPVDTSKVIALSQSLVSLGAAPADPLPVSAADDAARMAELISRLSEPPADPLAGLRPTVISGGTSLSASLGDLARRRWIRVIAGKRLAGLPTGQVRLWTADAVAAHSPAGVDLLALTAAHPDIKLTQPDDVIFCSAGSPHAVVDAEGGSAVAFPARILRVSATASCSPRAIAATINALPPGRSLGAWRSWRVPIVAGNRDGVEDVLRRIEECEDQARTRLAQIDELRRLATRSVTSGSVVFVSTEEKGQSWSADM